MALPVAKLSKPKETSAVLPVAISLLLTIIIFLLSIRPAHAQTLDMIGLDQYFGNVGPTPIDFGGINLQGNPGLPIGTIAPPGLNFSSGLITNSNMILQMTGVDYDFVVYTNMFSTDGGGTFARGVDFNGPGFDLDLGGDFLIDPASTRYNLTVEPELRTVIAGESTQYTVTVKINDNYEGINCGSDENVSRCFGGTINFRNIFALEESKDDIPGVTFDPESVFLDWGNDITEATSTLTFDTNLTAVEKLHNFGVEGKCTNPGLGERIDLISQFLRSLTERERDNRDVGDSSDIPELNVSCGTGRFSPITPYAFDTAQLQITAGAPILTDPDLTVENFFFIGSPYEPNAPMNGELTIRNSGPNITEPFTIGIYSTELPDQSCPVGDILPDTTLSFPGLDFGAETKSFTIANAPSIEDSYTATAFADNACLIVEFNDLNNTDQASYVVGTGGDYDGPSVPTWLQTFNGDVGTKADITMSQDPAENISTEVLVGNSIGGTINGPWKLSNYQKPLIPTGTVYNFFASRFKEKARAAMIADENRTCNFAGPFEGYYYCGDNNNFIIDSSISVSDSAVVFVDGDILIQNDINIGSSSIIFIASGDIIVSTSADGVGNVDSIDGIFIAGGTFRDCTYGCATAGLLTVNGSVYADSLTLPRALPSGNEDNPALIINFEAKYLDQVSNLLGSASIQWKEVAP